MSQRIYKYEYARDMSRAWNVFCEVRGLGKMAKDKDERIGKAFLAGYISGIAGKGVLDDRN